MLGIILLVLLIPAHVAWLIQRFTPSSPWYVSRAYIPGVVQAFFWSAEKMIGTADGAPGGPVGRLFNNIYTFNRVMVLASFTALITSALTINSLKGDINGPSDLVGKRVATVRGSTAASFLREIGALPVEFANFADAAAALAPADRGGAFRPAALVYDAPIVLYFVKKEATGRFAAVGQPFRAENYGIIFPLHSELRRAVNAALLKLTENGTYAQIHAKWFGKSADTD